MRPNVVLIVLDTARADAFEPYGAPPGSSPAISQLARRGTAVADAYSAACWTVPSHGAMFTGLPPRENGLVRAPGGLPHGCRPVLEAQRDRLLPEVMRRSGYATAGLSTNLWLTEESGFATGFDRFVSIDSERQGELSHGNVRSHLRWLIEATAARVDDGAAGAERKLGDWIAEAKPGEPFFWFVNLVECHSPYLPPRPYNDLGLADRIRAAEEARRYLTLGAIWQACAGGLEVPCDVLERMRHLYGRAIRALDDWVSRLAERLDQAGLLDDTLLIVTSDHGENLGEAGLMGHAFSLDDRLLRVPLVAAGPDAIEWGDLVSLTFLPAAIAGACGVEDHPWTTGTALPVAHFDPPTSASDPRVGEALSAWGLGREAAPRITTPLTAVTDGAHKLVLRGEASEFFDLRTDPLEEHPLSGQDLPTDVVARLEKALAGTARAERREPAAAAEEPSAEELAQLEERMRLLGYM